MTPARCHGCSDGQGEECLGCSVEVTHIEVGWAEGKRWRVLVFAMALVMMLVLVVVVVAHCGDDVGIGGGAGGVLVMMLV